MNNNRCCTRLRSCCLFWLVQVLLNQRRARGYHGILGIIVDDLLLSTKQKLVIRSHLSVVDGSIQTGCVARWRWSNGNPVVREFTHEPSASRCTGVSEDRGTATDLIESQGSIDETLVTRGDNTAWIFFARNNVCDPIREVPRRRRKSESETLLMETTQCYPSSSRQLTFSWYPQENVK